MFKNYIKENVALSKAILNKQGITTESPEYTDYLKIREVFFLKTLMYLTRYILHHFKAKFIFKSLLTQVSLLTSSQPRP